jgi:hypothetical protein
LRRDEAVANRIDLSTPWMDTHYGVRAALILPFARDPSFHGGLLHKEGTRDLRHSHPADHAQSTLQPLPAALRQSNRRIASDGGRAAIPREALAEGLARAHVFPGEAGTVVLFHSR